MTQALIIGAATSGCSRCAGRSRTASGAGPALSKVAWGRRGPGHRPDSAVRTSSGMRTDGGGSRGRARPGRSTSPGRWRGRREATARRSAPPDRAAKSTGRSTAPPGPAYGGPVRLTSPARRGRSGPTTAATVSGGGLTATGQSAWGSAHGPVSRCAGAHAVTVSGGAVHRHPSHGVPEPMRRCFRCSGVPMTAALGGASASGTRCPMWGSACGHQGSMPPPRFHGAQKRIRPTFPGSGAHMGARAHRQGRRRARADHLDGGGGLTRRLPRYRINRIKSG